MTVITRENTDATPVYHCKHCDKEKTQEEVISVPRDIWGKSKFIACRACNRRVNMAEAQSELRHPTPEL
jgi:DNA-directed RNA polymerase subunit RPC12/RpoP